MITHTVSRSRGFTLLELLVVIAIIGVLSSIVLASLNTARDKGNDTGVKANLATSVSQAALYYEEHGNSYGSADNTGGGASCTAANTLFADPTLSAAVEGANKDNGPRPVVCASTPTEFMVAAQTTNGKYWCVDSTGVKREISNAPDNEDTACPAN